MQKIVINRGYGGFSLSKEAMVEYAVRKGTPSYEYDIERDDPDLVAVVEEFGLAANGRHANLAVVEVPDDVEWTVEEYDGNEWVAEVHRTWS